MHQLFLKYTYRHPYGQKNWFLSVEGPVYAEPVRELEILINPPLGHTKKEPLGQNIKSQDAGFAKKKWWIKYWF